MLKSLTQDWSPAGLIYSDHAWLSFANFWDNWCDYMLSSAITIREFFDLFLDIHYNEVRVGDQE